MKRLMMLLVLLSGTAIAQDDPPDTPEKRLQEAWYMEVANGRYEEALAIYDEVLALPGLPLITRVQTQLRKAQTLRRLGRIEESRAIAEEIVRRYQPWSEDDPRAKKAAELTMAMGELERKLEKKRSYLSDQHPEYRKLQEQLEELRAQYSDISHFLIPELQRAGLWKLAEAAHQELLGENAEQATLHRKIESLIERLDSEDEATRDSAIKALNSVGPEVIPFALEALGSGDFFTCQSAAEVLIHYVIQNDEHIPALVTALRNGDKIARAAIHQAALFRLRPSAFLELLESELPAARALALDFGAYESQTWRHVDRVFALLEDSAAEVRASAVFWLMNAGRDDDRLKERFEEFAQDPAPDVRRAFASGVWLEWHWNELPDVLIALIPLLIDDDLDVSKSGMGAVSEIAPIVKTPDALGLSPAQMNAVLDGVENALKTGDKETRLQATKTIQIVQNDRSRELLFGLLKDSDEEVMRLALESLERRLDEADVIERLIEHLDDPEINSQISSRLQKRLSEPTVRDALLEHLFALPERLLSELIRVYPKESVAKTLESLDEFGRLAPHVQDQILRIIGSLRLESATPTVVQALRSEEKELVERALWVVTQMPAPDFIPPVIEHLRSNDKQILLSAISAAEVLRSPELVEPVGELAINSEDYVTRNDAISLLLAHEYPSSLPYAAQALTDEQSNIIDKAKQLISRLLWERDSRPVIESLLPWIDRIPQRGWEAVDSAIRSGGNAEDAQVLAGHLTETEPWRQSKILNLLPLMKNPEVLPFIRPLQDSPENDVRRAAQSALLRLGTFEDIQSLLDTDYGTAAIVALGKTGDARAIPVLLEQLGESTGARAARIVEALEPFARASSIPALIDNALSERAAWETVKGSLEGHPIEWKELASVRTLVHYPPEAALEGLARALESKEADARTRAEVIETLTRFDEDRARELILTQLDSDSATVRTKAIEALGTFLDADLLPMLVDLLRHRLPEVREAAQGSIEKIRFYLDQKRYAEGIANGTPAGEAGELVRMLEHEETAVRVAAAQALGRLHDPATLPALLRARKDSDENVRKAVEAALDRFTD